MIRRLVLITVLFALPLAACSRREPPQQPQPTLPDTAGDGARRAAELERMRQDSIARANAETDADARRRAEEVAARARAILEEVVHFDYDEADLRADAEEALARKVPILRANPGVRIRIVGHTDERGSLEYNLALGMRRASSVREYLAGFGIDASRLETTSMGEDSPVAQGNNESAWARNRRAEFVITAGGSSLTMPGS
ncbi:MAG TPA: OmpA family protein [Longimicrobiales bacterium]|nr:OmpA family protein [Longimicrobiales bacterium]